MVVLALVAPERRRYRPIGRQARWVAQQIVQADANPLRGFAPLNSGVGRTQEIVMAEFWTHEMRRDLYKCISKEFGPYRHWKGARRPPGKKLEFEAFLRDVAARLSKQARRQITPGAVDSQVAWAITSQRDISNQSHARNFILNKAAALEVYFLEATDLPHNISVRP